jgi:DNA-binding GntR family transcriptional regulator
MIAGLPMPTTVQRAEPPAHTPLSDRVELAETHAERESNTNRAYREVRQRILFGEMPPGAQYLEQELAEMLGMSRTPVREALIRLADERLVEVRPRHGARVLDISIRDIREIYELLAELESLAGRCVASNGATSAQIATLEGRPAFMVRSRPVVSRQLSFGMRK